MKKQNILVVDDEKSFVESTRSFILERGDKYNIITALNGKEALGIVEKQKIDLGILDIRMPVMDGIQFLTEIHNRDIWFPIIILSGYINHEINKEEKIYEDFGIVDYITKPVNLEELEKKIDDVLNHFNIYKDSFGDIDLYTMLDILKSEKKTAIVNINLGKQDGRIYFKKGDIIDAEVKGLSAEDALVECLKSKYSNNKIHIDYIDHKKRKNLNTDEFAKQFDLSRSKDKKNKPFKEEKMARMKDVLNSVNEEIGGGFKTASVFGADGIPVVIENPGNLDVDAFSAKFAIVSALVQKTVKDLSGGTVTEILIEDEKGWTLLRPIGKTGMSLFITVTSEATLGNLRLIARRLAVDLEKPA